MRTSILSRSVIAVASLAVGSAALVAAPAQAATTDGITRAQVLAAAAEARAGSTNGSYGPALAALAAKRCNLTGAGDLNVSGQAVETPDRVDGLIVSVLLSRDNQSFDLSDVDTCTFVALAPTAAKSTFTGGVDVEGTTLRGNFFDIFSGNDLDGVSTSSKQLSLSGDVFVSPARTTVEGLTILGFSADGLVKSPASPRTLTSVKIADKKTKADKRAAKKAYVKRLKAVKKSYAKAVKRARGDAAKKIEARMTYRTRRASAKATYRYAIADHKLVNSRRSTTDERRFSVSVTNGFFGPTGPIGPTGPGGPVLEIQQLGAVS